MKKNYNYICYIRLKVIFCSSSGSHIHQVCRIRRAFDLYHNHHCLSTVSGPCLTSSRELTDLVALFLLAAKENLLVGELEELVWSEQEADLAPFFPPDLSPGKKG